LKPENVLMKQDGTCKLCDFGIAKVVVGQTYTLCGTPEYMAPEVIRNKGHGHAVDWWCLGIFIYELFAGDTPFASASTLSIYKAINKGIDKVKWNQRVVDLGHKQTIQELCTAWPSRRLPMLSGGIGRLKQKKVFEKLDWSKMNTPEYQVPYKPKVDPATVCKGRVHRSDIAAIQANYKDDGTDWDKDF
jgi:serine/threonine protein kinase